MLGKRKGITSILAVLLSLLIVSPQLMVALLTAQTQAATPALISVENKDCVKTLTDFGENVPVQQLVTLETWTNGTRILISDHNANSPYDVCVNCTTWLDPTTTSNATDDNPIVNAEPPTLGAYSESGLFPYYRQNNDTDDLFFLLKGSNGTCFVSYDHDETMIRAGTMPASGTAVIR